MATKKLKKYAWDGGAKVHTKSQGEHDTAVQAKRDGVNLSAPLTAPMTTAQAYGQANAQAAAEYGPSVRAATSLERSAPAWFNDYVAQVGASQKAAQDYAAPLLATAQQGVTNAGATAPGLDPGSPQFATDQRAAQGRQAIAQLGATTLAAIPAAASSYFSGLQTTAAQELPQTQAYLKTQTAGLQSDQAAKAIGYFGDAKANAQNYSLAAQTLLGNQATDAATIDLNRGIDPVTGQPLPADPVSASDQKTARENKFFDEHGYWPSTGAPKPKAKPGLTPAQRQAKQERADKHSAAVRATSNKVISRVSDAMSAWEAALKTKVKTGKVIKGKDGNETEETATTRNTNTLRQMLQAQGYTPGEIHIALLRRVGKPLDQEALTYIRAQGVRLNHLPVGWVPAKPKRPGNAPDGQGGSRPT